MFREREDPDVRILAIDLGKQKSVACVYEAETGSHRYQTVMTSPGALHELVVETAPHRVVIEIGPTAGWVYDLVTAMEVPIEVANPSHEGWRWRRIKNKSDRRDALKLAQLSSSNQLPQVHMPSPEVRQWRELIQYRQSLVKRRTAIKNSIRSILTRMSLRMPAGASGWTRKSMTRLHELAMVEDGQVWRLSLSEELQQLEFLERSIKRVEAHLGQIGRGHPRVQQLKRIKGVGDRLAEAVVAVIDDPHRFRTGRQVGSYVGLTPRQFQSGSMDRQGRISGQGHRTLRTLLIQVAWLGLRRNNWMKELYERVRRGSDARKKIAIVAVARKLLIRCWAMMRDGTGWRDPQQAALRLAA